MPPGGPLSLSTWRMAALEALGSREEKVERNNQRGGERRSYLRVGAGRGVLEKKWGRGSKTDRVRGTNLSQLARDCPSFDTESPTTQETLQS